MTTRFLSTALAAALVTVSGVWAADGACSSGTVLLVPQPVCCCPEPACETGGSDCRMEPRASEDPALLSRGDRPVPSGAFCVSALMFPAAGFGQGTRLPVVPPALWIPDHHPAISRPLRL